MVIRMEQPTERLAAILATKQTQQGLTLRELAASASIPLSTLTYIMAGTRVVKWPDLVRIATALHVRPSELIAEAEADHAA
jgi:transcriptional regulator with XRE-family HTH domain